MALNINKNQLETLEVIEGNHIKLKTDLLNNSVTISTEGLAEEDHIHDNATSESDGFLSKEDKKRIDQSVVYNSDKILSCDKFFDGKFISKDDKLSVLSKVLNENIYSYLRLFNGRFSSDIYMNDELIEFIIDDSFDIEKLTDIKFLINGIDHSNEILYILALIDSDKKTHIWISLTDVIKLFLISSYNDYGKSNTNLTIIVNYYEKYLNS